MVNTKSDSGKEFILFKRQLYQLYEVQNRSIDEHEEFSLTLERSNLRWLYQANMDYIGEMNRVSHMDTLVAHGALKGSIFKAKMMNARRVYGLGSLTFAGLAYANMSTLSLMMGPTLPMLGIVGAAVYGARSLNERNFVSKIEYVNDGEFKGQLRVTIQKSPFVSYNVIMNPKFTKSICSIGEDDLGADDAEGNILYASEYYQESDGTRHSDGMFTVPADAFRDKITMEWIFADKNTANETDALFSD